MDGLSTRPARKSQTDRDLLKGAAYHATSCQLSAAPTARVCACGHGRSGVAPTSCSLGDVKENPSRTKTSLYCAGVNRKGKKCQSMAMPGSQFCHAHAPPESHAPPALDAPEISQNTSEARREKNGHLLKLASDCLAFAFPKLPTQTHMCENQPDPPTPPLNRT